MQHGDKPIKDKSTDLLGRYPLAKRFAHAIAQADGDDGFVVAIYGSWGSGKTSFKNLVKESLATDSPDVLALEFNPWRWSGEDALFDKFFSEIGKALGRAYGNDRKRQLVPEKWNLYSSILKVGSSIASSASLVLMGSDPALAAGALAVGSGAKRAAEVIDSAKDGLRAEAELAKMTLDEAKEDLANALRSDGGKIVVFIDDIDRLNEKEIIEQFQLIKANANLPKLVFVLLFQRDMIESSLKTVSPSSDGAAYLEKIVQFGLDLPALKQSDLERILFAELDKVLVISPKVLNQWNELHQHNWGNLYQGGFKYLFSNLRQVYRYINSVSFLFSGYLSDEYLEVDPIDLFAFEAVRIFQPKLYSEIKLLKAVLTGTDYSLARDERHKVYAATLERLVGFVTVSQKSAMEEVLKFLFPVLSAYDRGDAESNLRRKRLCHERYFDRYFSFDIQSSEITESQIDEFVKMKHSSSALTKKFEECIAKSQIDDLLESIDARQGEIPKHKYEQLISMLFNVGDAFYISSGLKFNAPDSKAYRLIRSLLKRLEDMSERKKIFLSALDRTNGLYLPVLYLMRESNESDRENFPDVFAFEQNDLPSLKGAVILKLKSISSKKNDLYKYPHFRFLLSAWSQWGKIEDMQKYFKKIATQREKMLKPMLNAFKYTVQISNGGDYVSTNEERINKAMMDKLGIIPVFEKMIHIERNTKDKELKTLLELYNKSSLTNSFHDC